MPDLGNLGRVGCVVVTGAVFCLIIAIALQYTTIHQTEKSDDQDVDVEPQASQTVKPSIHDKLWLQFPGVFYSPSQFAEYVRFIKNFTKLTGDTSRQSSNTPLCEGTYCKIEVGVYHTCCCISWSSFETPSTAIDIFGVNRTLAQFHGKNQYFYTESCQETQSPFFDCKCTAVPLYATGVYIHDVQPVEFRMDLFQIGNTCKDLNT